MFLVCHNLGEGGPGVKEGGLFYSQRKKDFSKVFSWIIINSGLFLALNRKKICTVKMMQFLWAKNGYTIEKTMDFFIWVGYPFSCHKGEDLFFTHRGGAGGCISPSPPCPCLTIQPIILKYWQSAACLPGDLAGAPPHPRVRGLGHRRHGVRAHGLQFSAWSPVLPAQGSKGPDTR